MPTFPTREERIGRLRAGLQGTNMRTASGPSKDFHLFTSIALHALDRKRRAKAPLSKLEAWTTGLFDTVVDGDDELDAYIEAVSSARRSKSGGGWLTTATLSLGDDEPYTVEHLQKDIASKGIGVQGTSPQFDANVRMIDPLTGERIGLDNEAFEAASAQAGRSTTVFWSEPEASANSNNTMSSLFKGPRVKLQPTFPDLSTIKLSKLGTLA